MALNRSAYTRLIADRLRMLFQDRGAQRQAFSTLKQGYYDGLKRDALFVDGMLRKIDKLCALYEKSRRRGLTRKFYCWR